MDKKNRILSTNARIIVINGNVYAVWMDEFGDYHFGDVRNENAGAPDTFGDLGCVTELISTIEDVELLEAARVIGDSEYMRAGLPGRER